MVTSQSRDNCAMNVAHADTNFESVQHVFLDPTIICASLSKRKNMEKNRRRRINNALDQLRTLLPFSVNMKKDMASLLEQTVEYINIMHTVLNEDKPVCLNKIYLCYRKKTEELESFRKNFKKTVQKRSKSEPGCSWGPNYPNFAHQSSGDVDTFVKFHGITSSYPDPNRINPGHWKISNCPPPPTNPIAYGKPSSQVNYSLAHSGSRSNFYQPTTNIPVKIYEPSCSQGNNQSQPSNEQVQTATEIGKIHHPMMKSDCWQPAQNYQVKQLGEAGSSRSSTVHHAAGSTTGPANDWYRYYGMQSTKQVLDLQGRTNQVHQMNESACYDENNNEQTSSAASLNEQPDSNPTPGKTTSDSLKDNSESSSIVVSSPNQTPEAGKDVDSSSCNIANAAIATGLLKCTSLAKQESNSPPEFYFTNNPENSNISNAFNSWMAPCTSLPALSLAHTYLGNHQHGTNIPANSNSTNSTAAVAEAAEQLKNGGIQMVKTPL